MKPLFLFLTGNGWTWYFLPKTLRQRMIVSSHERFARSRTSLWKWRGSKMTATALNVNRQPKSINCKDIPQGHTIDGNTSKNTTELSFRSPEALARWYQQKRKYSTPSDFLWPVWAIKTISLVYEPILILYGDLNDISQIHFSSCSFFLAVPVKIIEISPYFEADGGCSGAHEEARWLLTSPSWCCNGVEVRREPRVVLRLAISAVSRRCSLVRSRCCRWSTRERCPCTKWLHEHVTCCRRQGEQANETKRHGTSRMTQIPCWYWNYLFLV